MRLVLTLLLNVLALVITAYIVPGFKVADLTTAIFAAIVIGVINTFIRPVLLFLTAPLNFLTLGLFSFVVNAVVLWLATLVVPGLFLESALSALLAAVVLAVISTVLSALLHDLAKK